LKHRLKAWKYCDNKNKINYTLKHYKSEFKKFYKRFHEKYTLSRRTRVISQEILRFLPDHANILDIGCGGGEIAEILTDSNPTLKVSGIDIGGRTNSNIEITTYDGITIPFENNSFDFAIIVDVLHHTAIPKLILIEALRVSKRGIIVKDHNCAGRIQKTIMKITDTLGNWHHDVPLFFNFLSRKKWLLLWNVLNLNEEYYTTRLNIYSQFRGCIFKKDMDFISVLKKRSTTDYLNLD